MIDISGFGTSISVLALQSFPEGFSLTKFADDQDPLTCEVVETTGFEALYDGSFFFFDKASIIKISVATVAGSDDDINLKILLQARKGASSIIPLPDVTSMIISYPDGGRVAMSGGSILSGPLADSIQATGRKKGNIYTFGFGTFSGAQSANELISTVAQTLTSFL